MTAEKSTHRGVLAAAVRLPQEMQEVIAFFRGEEGRLVCNAGASLAPKPPCGRFATGGVEAVLRIECTPRISCSGQRVCGGVACVGVSPRPSRCGSWSAVPVSLCRGQPGGICLRSRRVELCRVEGTSVSWPGTSAPMLGGPSARWQLKRPSSGGSRLVAETAPQLVRHGMLRELLPPALVFRGLGLLWAASGVILADSGQD